MTLRVLAPATGTRGETAVSTRAVVFPFDLFGFLPDQIWRFTVSGDLSPRYSTFGIGVAAWH